MFYLILSYQFVVSGRGSCTNYARDFFVNLSSLLSSVKKSTNSSTEYWGGAL